MKLKLIRLIKIVGSLATVLWLGIVAMPVQAACKGCLCPGDPCGLCPLPPMTDDLVKSNESDVCTRIRESVPPISDLPGSNEYFASLDKATMVCIRQGGDVIRNSRRNEEFPARVYCKPPAGMK
jgi:hypothetical protein